jgi:hypothetical protein
VSHQPKHQLDWYGATLDVVVIISMTVLTALHVAALPIFLAVVGPIVGARLAAARMLRGDGGGPAGGALGVLLGLLLLLRRPGA